MARPFFPIILLALTGAQLAAIPAGAQFGGIFGNEPPRPPQGVPQRQGPPPEQLPPQQVPPQPGLPPGPQQRPPSGFQSQPLPPPSANPNTPAQPPVSGVVPAQRQPPRGGQQPQQPAQQPLPPPPPEEVLAEPPANKVPNPTGIFAGLDKITGRITSFDVAIGETVQFGALQVTPRACYTRPPTDTPHTDAFIEVDEVTLQGEIRRIYTGWMFAASPGLHAVEHPIYDVWLTDCKGAAVAEVVPEAAPSPPARAPARNQPQPPPPQRRVPQ
jgi:hypothetical protein